MNSDKKNTCERNESFCLLSINRRKLKKGKNINNHYLLKS